MTPPSELRGAVLGRGYRLGHAVEGDEAVFEATHERVPGKVVVRLFPNESLSRPDAPARIHQAVRLASLLRVPEAIQLLDFNLAGDTPAFVVTERVDGRTLAAVMAEDGMLSLTATIEIVDAVAKAVQAAHRLGLTHGDLRAPLIVVPDGAGPRARVGGFGWAKELRAAALHPAPPGLLAPEQHGGRVVTIDPRADQYGLAALAYELLAACPPFSDELPDGDSAARVPSPVGELVPGIPHEVDEVLRRALCQRPRDRFDDVAAFAARLRQAATSGPITIPLAALPAMAVPQTRRNGGIQGTPQGWANRGFAASDAAEPVTPPPIPAALPTTTSTEITEEMDRKTLWPLMAKADSGGTISSRILREDSLDIDLLGHVAAERGYGSDVELEIDVASSETAHALPGNRPLPRDPAAIAEMLAAEPTPPPEVATRVRQSPFTLPPQRAPETPAPITPPPPQVAIAPNRRPSAPYVTVPARARPSSSWPVLAPAPGPTPVQRVEAPQDRYVLQPVEINLGPPSTLSFEPPPLSAWPQPNGQGPAGSGQRPSFAAYDAFAGPFSDAYAGVVSPVRVRTGTWKAVVAAVMVAGATVAGGLVLWNRPPLAAGRGVAAERAPGIATGSPPSVGGVPLPGASGSPIIAPVDPATVDPTSNGQGDCALRITSTPAAAVSIDGKDTGHLTPLVGFRVTCGLHRVLLRRPDTGMQRADVLKVLPGQPNAANYTWGPSTLAPSTQASLDAAGPQTAASKHTGLRHHRHRKHHRPQAPAVYVDEFE